MALVLALGQFCGCATIVSKHNEKRQVNFDANVENVQIQCVGGMTHTPGSLVLKKSKTHHCVATKEGYEDYPFKVKSGFSGSEFGVSTALNLPWGLFTFGMGLVIGWVIDFASGAMRDLRTKNLYIEMVPKKPDSLTRKVVNKSIAVTKALVTLPTDLARETTQAMVGTTVGGSAEKLGIHEKGEQ